MATPRQGHLVSYPVKLILGQCTFELEHDRETHNGHRNELHIAHSAGLYISVLYSAVQYISVQCSGVEFIAVQCSSLINYCTVQCSIVVDY